MASVLQPTVLVPPGQGGMHQAPQDRAGGQQECVTRRPGGWCWRTLQSEQHLALFWLQGTHVVL